MKKDWEMKRLGEVCEIINGGTPKSNEKSYWDGDVLWVTPKDLGQLKSRYIDDTPRKITKLGLNKSSAKLFPAHSIILSTRAPIGHLAINLKNMSTNQGCRGLVPNKETDVNYLYYFLRKSKEKLNDLGTGATFKELSRNVLAEIIIPKPKISEQKRIVKILDEAFKVIDKAKENAEKNLANVKELFESYLNNIFNNPSDDWGFEEIENLCLLENGDRGKNYPSRSKHVDVGIPFVNAGHLNNGKIDFTNMNYISKNSFNLINSGKYIKNDILFCLRGSLGKYGIVENDNIGAIASSLVIVRVKERILPKYLLYYFNSQICNDMIKKFAGGAAQPNLGAKDLAKFKVPLSKIDIQNKIINKFDNLSLETKKLEDNYKKELAGLEELKKSILNKAFSGEL